MWNLSGEVLGTRVHPGRHCSFQSGFIGPYSRGNQGSHIPGAFKSRSPGLGGPFYGRQRVGNGLHIDNSCVLNVLTLMTEHRGQTAGYANFCPIFEIKWDWSRIHLARLLR